MNTCLELSSLKQFF